MKLQKHSWIFAVNFIAVATCLIFSLEFYAQISLFFCAFVIILEITKSLFTRYILDKSIGLPLRMLALIICIIATMFSVFGSIANGFNFISQNMSEQYKSVENQEYLKLQDDIKLATKDLEYYRNELNKMPDVQTFVGNIPSWQPETREKLTLKYSEMKKEKEDKILSAQNKLDSLKAKNINSKVKVKVKESGYSNILQQVSDLTEWKIETIILIITIALSLGLELVIITSSLICKKTTKVLENKSQNWESENIEKEIKFDQLDLKKVRKRYTKKKSANSTISTNSVISTDIEDINNNNIQECSWSTKNNISQLDHLDQCSNISSFEDYKKLKSANCNEESANSNGNSTNSVVSTDIESANSTNSVISVNTEEKDEWIEKFKVKYGDIIPNRNIISNDFNISIYETRKILDTLKEKCLIKRTNYGMKIINKEEEKCLVDMK